MLFSAAEDEQFHALRSDVVHEIHEQNRIGEPENFSVRLAIFEDLDGRLKKNVAAVNSRLVSWRVGNDVLNPQSFSGLQAVMRPNGFRQRHGEKPQAVLGKHFLNHFFPLNRCRRGKIPPEKADSRAHALKDDCRTAINLNHTHSLFKHRPQNVVCQPTMILTEAVIQVAHKMLHALTHKFRVLRHRRICSRLGALFGTLKLKNRNDFLRVMPGFCPGVIGIVGIIRVIGVIRVIRVISIIGVIGIVSVIRVIGIIGVISIIGVIGVIGIVGIVGVVSVVSVVSVIGVVSVHFFRSGRRFGFRLALHGFFQLFLHLLDGIFGFLKERLLLRIRHGLPRLHDFLTLGRLQNVLSPHEGKKCDQTGQRQNKNSQFFHGNLF